MMSPWPNRRNFLRAARWESSWNLSHLRFGYDTPTFPVLLLLLLPTHITSRTCLEAAL